jgi:ADP-ribose pyrophosphatase YjhB (NUDIX family)
MKARFCSQCGHRIATREVAGRTREVCAECGTVFYRNPLPVAAAVVLDAQRRVLLIQRKHAPRRGLWCLPMGFAELGETIVHAARRELAEEAGIQGRATRLLGAESAKIEPYGDLLVITFELEKTGGVEEAGDDAAKCGYFSLDALPRLAFAANQRAIRQCLRAHREPWAIQDSFQHLQEHTHEAMLSDALVALISRHARAIADAWLEEVRSHPATPSYARVTRALLRRRAVQALSQFSDWLSSGEEQDGLGRFYRELGAERRDQGFALNEVLRSLALLRQHMLRFAMERGVWHGALDAYTVVELDHRIIGFFDQALYHAALGYERVWTCEGIRNGHNSAHE